MQQHNPTELLAFPKFKIQDKKYICTSQLFLFAMLYAIVIVNANVKYIAHVRDPQ